MLVAHKASDRGGFLHHTVGVFVEVHADDDISGDTHATNALLRISAVLHDVLIGNLDLENRVFHVLVGNTLLKVCLHLALVTGVGVNDVPVAGRHVEFAAQLFYRIIF